MLIPTAGPPGDVAFGLGTNGACARVNNVGDRERSPRLSRRDDGLRLIRIAVLPLPLLLSLFLPLFLSLPLSLPLLLSLFVSLLLS
jgi:hypothetical protein